MMTKSTVAHPVNPLWLYYIRRVRENQDAMFRIFVYGFGLTVGYLGVTDHYSLMYAAGREWAGNLLIVLIIIASLVGILEMLLNNNGKCGANWLKRHRHLILLSLAFCFLGQLFVAYDSVRSDGIRYFFIWPSICTMAAAVADAHKRGKELCNKI